MPFSVAVVDEAGYYGLAPERATRLCAAAFHARGLHAIDMGEVSVAFVPLSVMHELNLQYRNVDSPTDVLSFEIDGPFGEMVGEIVVAPEYVRYDRTGVEELVVHGALHLAGMDHGDEFESTEMAVVQKAVLKETDVREG